MFCFCERVPFLEGRLYFFINKQTVTVFTLLISQTANESQARNSLACSLNLKGAKRPIFYQRISLGLWLRMKTENFFFYLSEEKKSQKLNGSFYLSWGSQRLLACLLVVIPWQTWCFLWSIEYASGHGMTRRSSASRSFDVIYYFSVRFISWPTVLSRPEPIVAPLPLQTDWFTPRHKHISVS